VRFGSDELATGLEAFRHDLIGGFTVEHALAARIVSSVEPAQKLLEVPVRVEGDAEHLAADSTVKTLHHAIRLWGVGFRMAVLRTEFRTSLGESGRKATAVIGEHMREAKRKSRRCLPQEGDGSLLGFIVFDCSMHRARTPVDGDIEIALAPFAVASPQLRQVFYIDVHKTKIIFLEGPFSFCRSGGNRSGPAIESLRLQKAPDAVAVEVWQKMRDDEGEIIQRKVGAPAQRADHSPFFFRGFPGQLVRPGGMVPTILDTAFAPLADGLGADTVASGQDASRFLRAGNLGTDGWGRTGVGVNLQHGLSLS
jgi:hypothetical protein